MDVIFFSFYTYINYKSINQIKRDRRGQHNFSNLKEKDDLKKMCEHLIIHL